PSKSNGAGLLHPRISFGKANAGGFPAILVDLLFIDVTDSIRGRGLLKKKGTPSYDSDWAENGEPNGTDPHYGCNLFILELAVGKPKAWAVIVPPAAQRYSNDTNVLLFFPPAQRPYTSTLDCDYANPSLERYSKDPPTYGPFFFYVLGKDKTTGRDRFTIRNYPETGFEGQLVASGKPVILVIPFPHTESDKVNYGRAAEADLKKLLSALVRVIWEKVLPGSKRP